MLAISLRQPNDARARPTDYLREDDKYEAVFGGDKFNLGVYLKNTQIVRRTDEYLTANQQAAREHHLNLLFYVALYSAGLAIGNAHMPPNLLLRIELEAFNNKVMLEGYQKVYSIYEEYGKDDRAAKGPEMREKITKTMEQQLHGK
jgi:hypothetical protein